MRCITPRKNPNKTHKIKNSVFVIPKKSQNWMKAKEKIKWESCSLKQMPFLYFFHNKSSGSFLLPKVRIPLKPKKGRDYFAYHKVNGHKTDECHVLSKIIQNMVKSESLKEFIKNA